MTTSPLRLGISRCLLGEQVRFDGGHKRNTFLTEVLGRFVEWVPICPEVEAGLGTPREPMKLAGNPRHPRLITVDTRQDKTKVLERFSTNRVRELTSRDLSGFVFKARSPSCGVQAVPVYDRAGGFTRSAVGLFAHQFMERFPFIPIEEEDRLLDTDQRTHFLERVYCYRRWCEFVRSPITKQGLAHFHATHKYLLMAHSPSHSKRMGSLLARNRRSRPAGIAKRYGIELANAMRVRPSLAKHTNVLQHLLGYFRNRLTRTERVTMQRMVERYRAGDIPLAIPLTAIKEIAQRLELTYLSEQVYFEPYPRHLMEYL